MTKNKDPNQESLAEIAIDPDVLARELALDIEIDPLEQIDEDVFSNIRQLSIYISNKPTCSKPKNKRNNNTKCKKLRDREYN